MGSIAKKWKVSREEWEAPRKKKEMPIEKWGTPRKVGRISALFFLFYSIKWELFSFC